MNGSYLNPFAGYSREYSEITGFSLRLLDWTTQDTRGEGGKEVPQVFPSVVQAEMKVFNL